MKADADTNAIVTVGKAKFGNSLPFALIAGPCALESRAHALEMAAALKEIAARRRISFVYNTSFDKANRTSSKGARGLGLDQSLQIFADLRESLSVPVLTDVHEAAQCARAAEVVDVLQIPAFLCRQTDLLVAAANTGRVVNVKKGQFLAPWDMKNVVAKITGAGNRNVLVTERGASFGYNTLVSDMRALPILARETGAPVIFDATHSVQQPGGQGTSSGGEREFVPVLARAAVAVGVAGVFIETHQDPDKAPSDGPNMIALKDIEGLIGTLQEFDRVREIGAIDHRPVKEATMVMQSLSGLPAFLAYFCVSVGAVIIYLVVYTRVTPHDEFALIGEGKPGPAISLGLSLIGFALPVASAVAHAANIIDCVIWSLIALIVQIVAYFAAQVPVSDLAGRIAKGELGAAVWLGLASLTAGVLSAASMTL